MDLSRLAHPSCLKTTNGPQGRLIRRQSACRTSVAWPIPACHSNQPTQGHSQGNWAQALINRSARQLRDPQPKPSTQFFVIGGRSERRKSAWFSDITAVRIFLTKGCSFTARNQPASSEVGRHALVYSTDCFSQRNLPGWRSSQKTFDHTPKRTKAQLLLVAPFFV